MTKITRQYKNKKNFTGFLSVLCTFGPVIFFGIQALLNGIEIGESATVDITFLILMTGMAAILTLVGIFRKYVYRSIPYFMILGIFFLLETIVPLIITMAVCTILDELIFTPLHSYYREKYSINKEIDKRGTTAKA